MVVAAFITSAYWFTSSTSFANPAVTFARAMTDTFAGISPRSVPLFVAGQLVGAALATWFARWLLGAKRELDETHRYVSRVNRASPVNKKVNVSASGLRFLSWLSRNPRTLESFPVCLYKRELCILGFGNVWE